jgi:hypothetical protein
MRKALLPLLCSLGMVLNLPLLTAGQTGTTVSGDIPERPISLNPHATATIHGTLRYDRNLLDRLAIINTTDLLWGGHVITVNGVTYVLDLSQSEAVRDAAARLNGKQVRIEGRLELRQLPGTSPRVDFVTHYSALVVTSLTPVSKQPTPDSATVEVVGTLRFKTHFGYPTRGVETTVEINGRHFILSLPDSLAMHQLVEQLDGKLVSVRGTLGEFRHFPIMCVPHGDDVQVIHVNGLIAIPDLFGTSPV